MFRTYMLNNYVNESCFDYWNDKYLSNFVKPFLENKCVIMIIILGEVQKLSWQK